MGLFSKDIKTMEDLLLHGLQDIYYAEQQITKALPKMIEQATNRDLAQGLKAHLEETNNQIQRLEQVFKKLGQKPSGTDCPAIDGLIKESNETAGEIDDKSVLDAAIVANAQAVEHYEIARYGTLIAWAKSLGRPDCASVLEQNLAEEKATDAKLTQMAEAAINLLLHKIRRPKDRHVHQAVDHLVLYVLVKRDSVAPPRKT